MNKHLLYDECLGLLKSRGVSIEDIGECVLFLQKQYHPELVLEDVLPNVESVLRKREVQNALITGIELDILKVKNESKKKIGEKKDKNNRK